MEASQGVRTGRRGPGTKTCQFCAFHETHSILANNHGNECRYKLACTCTKCTVHRNYRKVCNTAHQKFKAGEEYSEPADAEKEDSDGGGEAEEQKDRNSEGGFDESPKEEGKGEEEASDEEQEKDENENDSKAEEKNVEDFVARKETHRQDRSSTPCKRGNKCTFKLQNRCHFFHLAWASQVQAPGGQVQAPNMQVQPPKVQLQPSVEDSLEYSEGDSVDDSVEDFVADFQEPKEEENEDSEEEENKREKGSEEDSEDDSTEAEKGEEEEKEEDSEDSGYSAQWAEYYRWGAGIVPVLVSVPVLMLVFMRLLMLTPACRSIGKVKEAEAIEQQMRAMEDSDSDTSEDEEEEEKEEDSDEEQKEEESVTPPVEEERPWKRKAEEQEEGRECKAGRYQEPRAGPAGLAIQKRLECMEKVQAEMTAAMQAAADGHRAAVEAMKRESERATEELSKTKKELETAIQTNTAKTAEVDALNTRIEEKDALAEKEKVTVLQLKKIGRKFRELKEIEEKKVKALEEDERRMEEAHKLLQESMERIGILEAETKRLGAQNTEIKETCALEEDRVKEVLKNAMNKIQKVEDAKKELEAKTEQLQTENTKLKKENTKHECSFQGCGEMVAFKDVKDHVLVCKHRLVVCPGSDDCKEMVPFCKVKEHADGCQMINMDRKIEQGRPFGLPETLVQSLAPRSWKSVMYRADSGGVFFLRTSRENKVFSLEVVMLGTQEKCKKYTIVVSIKNLDTKEEAFQAHYTPRPISDTNVTSHFCLTFKQDSLSDVWRFNRENKKFEFLVSAEIQTL